MSVEAIEKAAVAAPGGLQTVGDSTRGQHDQCQMELPRRAA